jgi:hypothetical protein
VKKAIQVLQNAERDWLVREDGGRELGHYTTRDEAHAVGHKVARKRGVELVVPEHDGKMRRSRAQKGWFARLFAR